MVKISWTERAALAKEKVLELGYKEFGETAVKRLYRRILEVQDQLECFPFIGKCELLLEDFALEYRSIVFHIHYKIVYYYDESTDTVYISDIWDTRRSPRNLRKRISD